MTCQLSKKSKTEKSSDKFFDSDLSKLSWFVTMASAGSGSGIAQLLNAEKKAAEKVAEAKKRKNRRLKQVRNT